MTLKLVLLIAQALLFLIRPGLSQTCDSLDADVLILGGGMAGVAAANRFYEEGISFLLLEAGENLGGRIKNLEISPGVYLTEGASFIHGIDLNETKRNLHPLIDLANKCGGLEGVLLDYESDYIIRVYNSSGSDVTEPFFQRAEAYYESLTVAQNYSEIRRAANLRDQSFRQGLDVGHWVVTTSLDNFTEWEEFDWCVADTPDVSSLYGNIDQETFTDFHTHSVGDFWITDNRGFLHLINCLVKPFSNDRSRIRLNTLVTKINNMESCVCVTTNSGNFCGKYAIITFSIGVIKSTKFQENVLTPPLSVKKLQALDVMTMGHYLQIYLVFERRFWDTEFFFVGYVSEVRGYYPVFITLKDTDSVNAMTFIVTGDMALKVLNQNESTTQEEIMDILRIIYNNSIPGPQRIYIAKFPTDPLFLGSYANVKVGLTSDTFPDLSSPEGRLYFAGEGVSEKYRGFVHGAYISGIENAVNLSRVILNIPNLTTSGGCHCYFKNILIIDLLLLSLNILTIY